MTKRFKNFVFQVDEAETTTMSETVDNEELEKNFMIKTLLDNLHSTDRDLENTIVDAADGEKLKNEEIAHRIIG